LKMAGIINAFKSFFSGDDDKIMLQKKAEADRLMKLGGLCGYEYVVEDDGKTHLRKSRAAFPKLFESLEKQPEEVDKQKKDEEEDKEDDKKKSPLAFEFLTQEHYVMVGKAVTNEIYRRMKDDFGLEEVVLHDIGDAVEGVPIFMTPGMIESEKPLIVIICGSGEVTSGMWARSICINNSLEEGTALPDLAEAQKNGYNVLLMNPNTKPPRLIAEESDAKKAHSFFGDGSPYSPEKHALTVWKNFVEPCHAKKIGLFVHSYGGVIALELLKYANSTPEVMSRLSTMVMTDAVHFQSLDRYYRAEAFIHDSPRVRNWVRSDTPLDTPLGFGASGISIVSSGHTVHEWTTYSSRGSLWPFIVSNINKDLPVYDVPEQGDELDDSAAESERLIKLGGLCGYEFVTEEDGKTRLHKTHEAFPLLNKWVDAHATDESKKEKCTDLLSFRQANEAHYLAVVEGTRAEIYKRMTENLGLQQVLLEGDPNEENVPIFMSPGLVESEKPLVVIICGSGEVSPGMWTRRVCVKHSLEEGTALPDIAEAQKHGYNVLLMNPNANNLMKKDTIDGPVEHALFVWKKYVEPCHAKKIALFVHSFGGVVALELLKYAERTPEVLSRIVALAMTDSVHHQSMDDFPHAKAFIEDQNKARNWVGSDKALDTPEGVGRSGIFCVSSGHREHEWTTCSARGSLWPFLVSNIEKKPETEEEH